MPGVQNPHWRPWWSQNARCTGYVFIVDAIRAAAEKEASGA
jgi:hypothetical protein